VIDPGDSGSHHLTQARADAVDLDEIAQRWRRGRGTVAF